MIEVAEAIKGDVDAPFWAATQKGQFLVHRCELCGKSYWPASCCTQHGAIAMRWVPASGKATIHTYTIFYHAYRPDWAARVPFALAVVTLEEGPFYHTRIVDCPIETVKTGLAVEMTFETLVDGRVLPIFKPAAAA